MTALLPELRLAKIVRIDLRWPGPPDYLLAQLEPGMAREEARVDRLGIGNHPQAQAGRPAAVCHGLAHLDRDKLADRPIARDELRQPKWGVRFCE